MLLGPVSLAALLHAACFVSVAGLSPEFIACQVKKPAGQSPLLGCPQGTIFVSNNMTDSFAHFNSIQDAIVPVSGSATILIGEGEYHETINVTRSAPLTLLATSVDKPKYPLDTLPSPMSNLVQIFDTNFVEPGMDDATSAVLIVAPSFNGSLIGAGPTGAPLQPLVGNSDFRAYNIDWSNRAVRAVGFEPFNQILMYMLQANFAISQALVTDISYANASFYGCSFASFQDTWYTGRNGSTYVVDSVIFGQTDYLFGFGTAFV
ncbi:hypothetical protein C0992_011107 [Termitomyces sp. T32_za158]|nr:hypothetical protein C0992_011107 [Termitomyces sp. T32_za158]